MSAQQKRTLLLAIGAPLAVILLSWGAKKYDSSKLDVWRFEQDSIRRAAGDSLLRRIDKRVTSIYCADKPPGCQ